MKKEAQVGIIIDNLQSDFLSDMSAKHRISRTEVIRRLVNEDMDQHNPDEWYRREWQKFPLRLYDEQAEYLMKLCEMSNLPKTEVVRRLIDKAIARNTDNADD